MTEDRLPLAELMAKAGDGNFLRGVAEAVVQLLMETDVYGLIGAGRHERMPEQFTYRNGYRDRVLDTLLPSLPEAAAGHPRSTSRLKARSAYSSWRSARRGECPGGRDLRRKHLDPRARCGPVAMTIRKVDALVQGTGLAGISKSAVSELRRHRDDRVSASSQRPLDGDRSNWAGCAPTSDNGQGRRMISVAAIIAVAANTEGKREVVGLLIGFSKARPSGRRFRKVRSAAARLTKPAPFYCAPACGRWSARRRCPGRLRRPNYLVAIG